ncbi:MAG: hypothetical protein ACXW3C_04035, partial [Pyrinomonadaceae bacterium]
DRSIARIHKADDGNYHITYSFAAGTPDAVKQAAADAFGQWNALTGTTKVVFEEAQPGATGFIEFQQSDDPSNNGGCAAFRKSSDRVFFSSGFASGAGQNLLNQMSAAVIIAHELGHFLGLGEAGLDPATPTIMNNGDPAWDVRMRAITYQRRKCKLAMRVKLSIASLRRSRATPAAAAMSTSMTTIHHRRMAAVVMIGT